MDMNDKLPVGYKVETKIGGFATVIKHLGEGGQGDVYEVEYCGERKALKWYKPIGMGRDKQAFYDNIESNIKRGTPSPEFLWPQDITKWTNGVFGYIMDIRPEGYYELGDFMLNNAVFKSYKTIVDAALQIVSAYRILHDLGYSYQDLNDGNFFINPQNGKVLICDNDNVAPTGVNTGIIGKPRYIAPEIVLGKTKPNKLTDRFSMSIILFILFCMQHPLEGKRSLVPALTPEIQKKLYGTDALFIMDPDDHANAPKQGIHNNVLNIWPCLPDYIQQLFTKAFSQKAMTNPNARPTEFDWLSGLVRFRSEIMKCSCGNEVFTQNGESCKCECCGRKLSIPFRLEFTEYSIPGIPGSRVYRCQLGTCNAEDALQPVGAVLANQNNPSLLGVRNVSGKMWQAVTPSGKSKKVLPKEVIPLKDGITFMVGSETIKIKANA